MNKNISIIVAVDNNNGIGRKGDQLAYISGDLKRFKELTTGHTIIMGRKTFEALPKGALPNRRNMVITRNNDFKPENCEVYHSVEQALENISEKEEVFIIGGGEIYKVFLPFCNKIYLTVIDHEFDEVDTCFPKIDTEKWGTIEEEGPFADEKSGMNYRYVTLQRK